MASESPACPLGYGILASYVPTPAYPHRQVSLPMYIADDSILYRVAWILLHRPQRSRSSSAAEAYNANQICTSRSAEINLLFGLHERTFNLRNITYLLAYMAYVTATIDVDEAMSNEPSRSIPAKSRLELTLRVLTQASLHTPGIQRSIRHLRYKLDNRSVHSAISGTNTPTTAHPSASMAQNQIAPEAITLDESQFGPSTSNIAAVDLGFEELFASLLPEYAPSNPVSWDELGLNNMASATGEFDWMWS